MEVKIVTSRIHKIIEEGTTVENVVLCTSSTQKESILHIFYPVNNFKKLSHFIALVEYLANGHHKQFQPHLVPSEHLNKSQLSE